MFLDVCHNMAPKNNNDNKEWACLRFKCFISTLAIGHVDPSLLVLTNHIDRDRLVRLWGRDVWAFVNWKPVDQ